MFRDFQKLFSNSMKNEEFTPLLKGIIPGGTLLPENALKVYRNGYVVRLTESLGEIYETIWWILGDDQFFATAAEYIETHDSVSHNLSHYGSNFSSYLKLEFPEIPFIEELAAFEWTFQESFHSPEHFPSKTKSIDFSEPEKVYIQFSKSAKFLHHSYAIFEFWKNRKEDQSIMETLEWEKEEYLILNKRDTEMYVHHLTESQFALFKLLESGENLDGALENVSVQFDISEEEVQNFFKIIFENKLAEIR